MATIHSNATGNWSATGTWIGGVVPGAGDAAVIDNTHTVTVDVDTTVGRKDLAIGAGITVNSGGTLAGTAGKVLTVRGFDTGTNKAIQVAANGNFTPAGMTISVDSPSDWGTIINVDGNMTCVGTIFTIPTANITWSNATGNTVVGGISAFPYDLVNSIYVFKLSNTNGDLDPGPVANLAGSGLGSFGNSSFSVSAGGWSGSTSNEVASYAAIASNGDYYMDYAKGVVYYKSSSRVLTITYAYKFATWLSYGILCTANNATTTISITGSTQINYAGVNSVLQSSENTQGALMIDNKLPPAIATGNGLTLDGVVFNYCSRALQYYESILAGATALHHQVINSLTFNNCRYNGTGGTPFLFSSGLINHGWGSYTDYTNLVFNSCCPLFTSTARGPANNITVSGCTGAALDGTLHLIVAQLLPHNGFSPYSDCAFVNNGTSANPLTGAGGNFDTNACGEPGISGHPNVYTGNYLRAAHRFARMDAWMTVSNNYWDRTFHHGGVCRASDGYISNFTFSYNICTNCADPNLDNVSPSGGGFTFGYNRKQWIDNVIIEHNTFDTSNRSIQFLDYENSVVLVTRSIIRNNILSGNQQGIRLEAGNATNFGTLALTQVDYNDDDANSTYPTNILQGTFIMGGVNYNTSGSKTAGGCYLFNPSYSLPDGTLRSLVLTVTGTAGTNKSIKAAWGSGTGIEFVADQNTATSATNPAGGPAVITKTAAGWTVNAYLGCQFVITSGTGAGQCGFIYQNDATTVTVLPNTLVGNWAVTPDSTSVFLIIKPHQTLTDASTGTVSCGIYSPELQFNNGTYTDPSITITKNYPGTSGANNGVNPNYVSASNLTPRNSALSGTASDGTFIGALPIQAALTAIGWMPFWTGDNF